MKAFKIYQKYIKIGSEFELNLHYAQRHHLMELMDDYQSWLARDVTNNELLLLFEDIKQELIKLLRFSWSRLKTTKQIQLIQEELCNI